MNQTKATQTKKKSTPVTATKRSSNKNATARKAPRTTPTAAPEPEVVAAIAIEGDSHEMPVEAIPDASTAPSDANDEVNDEAITYEPEIDLPVQLEAEIATESEGIELPASIRPLDEAAIAFEPKNSSPRGEAEEDVAAEDANPLVQGDVLNGIVAATPSAEDGVNVVPATEIKVENEVGVNPPLKKAKGIERQLRATSPRYAAACAEVGRLRKEFLHALDRKAEILGVKRVGEAVPVRNDEIAAIDIEIREARLKLDQLVDRKRQMRVSSPELDEVKQTIRALSQQRKDARMIKQAAFAEATAEEATAAAGL